MSVVVCVVGVMQNKANEYTSSGMSKEYRASECVKQFAFAKKREWNINYGCPVIDNIKDFYRS